MLVAFLAALAACASKRRAGLADERSRCDGALGAAWLVGDTRIEAQEFDKARSELARTGRADLLARAELKRCAARVASLVFEPCEGFEKLRADAARPNAPTPTTCAAACRRKTSNCCRRHSARRLACRGSRWRHCCPAAIDDPLSRLVAAGVLFQAGRASPPAIALAVDTASQQGWRRPLAAWLRVQARLAEQAGDGEEAARLRRRIEVVMQDGK